MSRLAREKGFTFKQDGEHGFRRVVASPAPLKILEAAAIKVCHAVTHPCTHACVYGPQALLGCRSGTDCGLWPVPKRRNICAEVGSAIMSL